MRIPGTVVERVVKRDLEMVLGRALDRLVERFGVSAQNRQASGCKDWDVVSERVGAALRWGEPFLLETLVWLQTRRKLISSQRTAELMMVVRALTALLSDACTTWSDVRSSTFPRSRLPPDPLPLRPQGHSSVLVLLPFPFPSPPLPVGQGSRGSHAPWAAPLAFPALSKRFDPRGPVGETAL